MSPPDIFPPGGAVILVIGRDDLGRWLVSEAHGQLDRTFPSYGAALEFAQGEGRSRSATIATSCAPTE